MGADNCVLRAALTYQQRGWRSIPLEPRRKKPIGDNWQNRRIERDELPHEFYDDRNLGLLLGEASGGLGDVDLDCTEALRLAPGLLPPTGAIFGRASAPRSHWAYQVTPVDFRTIQFVDPLKRANDHSRMIIELRGTGGQTMAPPSVHPCGERVEWDSDGEAASVNFGILKSAVARTAAAALLARYWPRGNRHFAALALAGALLRSGWGEDDLDHFVLEVARAAHDEEAMARRTDVRSTARRLANGAPATGGPTCKEVFGAPVWGKVREWLDLNAPDPERSAITLKSGELPEIVDVAEEVLVDNAERLKIFQRAGEVVRIISLTRVEAMQANRRDGLERPEGAVVLHSVTQTALLEIFDRLVAWQVENAKGEKKPKDCPSKIASSYLSRVGFWKLPYLAGVVEAPLLRPDGTVLNVSGYDQKTGLFLDCAEGWPSIPRNPVQAEAEAALQVLMDPFSEFPFITDEDRSVFLSGILTALQRRLLRSAPLFGFSAPSQRSGKSLLVESIGIIATGRIPAAAGVSRETEELRKAITSTLREGHLIAHLDNITHPLDSPDLARAITQSVYSDRLLGTNTSLRLPTNVLWTATGNNLVFKGDMPSRGLLCRIDAQMEHPEERGFRIADLHAHLIENRKRLVMAALTILRAYHVAGRPKQNIKPWGGFDHWSREIREPLVWLGCVDPYKTRARIIVNDPERDCALSILSAWRNAFGDRAMLVAKVITEAGIEADPKASKPRRMQLKELRERLLMVAAADRTDPAKIDARRLGAWCRSIEDRIFGDFRLSRAGSVSRATAWRVSSVSCVSSKAVGSNSARHVDSTPDVDASGSRPAGN